MVNLSKATNRSIFMQKSIALCAIAAMAENRVIGVNNQLPWHLPADLRRFKTLTTGHAILMGRKTHESIGKPLPNRLNLVMSRDPQYQALGCITIPSLKDAVLQTEQHKYIKLFIIGGAEIYRQLLPEINELYLTIIHKTIEGGDAFFPNIHSKNWIETDSEHHPISADNPCAFTFLTLSRR